MSAPTDSKPRVALVFDVNVILDAIEGDDARADAAARALSSSTGYPVYMSDMLLKTVANKLLEHGADPEVVQEYLDLVMESADLGDEIHTFEWIKITNYNLRDKYGNPDYEDATVVSLMDAAEEHAKAPALLVTSDGALRDWCHEHKRLAVRPDQLQRLLSQHADELQKATYQYLGRRMFRDGTQAVDLESTKSRARDLVTAQRAKTTSQQRTPFASRFEESSDTVSPDLEL